MFRGTAFTADQIKEKETKTKQELNPLATNLTQKSHYEKNVFDLIAYD